MLRKTSSCFGFLLGGRWWEGWVLELLPWKFCLSKSLGTFQSQRKQTYKLEEEEAAMAEVWRLLREHIPLFRASKECLAPFRKDWTAPSLKAFCGITHQSPSAAPAFPGGVHLAQMSLEHGGSLWADLIQTLLPVLKTMSWSWWVYI